MKEYLFVYGSLLNDIQSQMATFLKQEGQYLGEAYIKGKLFDLGRYPGLIYLPKGEKEVFGHLYEIYNPKFCFSILDRYEGIMPNAPESSEYKRENCIIQFQEQEMESWVYLYNFETNKLKEIPSGNYLKFLQSGATDDHHEFIDSV
jgi:gamma-glutamylcyclotransferase (GGCT)/AIG2-like uncharacterized protein YtfP